jgi:hypothetical protein
VFCMVESNGWVKRVKAAQQCLVRCFHSMLCFQCLTQNACASIGASPYPVEVVRRSSTSINDAFRQLCSICTANMTSLPMLELTERDEAGNVTSTYVENASALGGKSRVDVIVRAWFEMYRTSVKQKH